MSKTTAIDQVVKFHCTPEQLYLFLTDGKFQTAVTGAKAVISKKAGGKFSAWDGYITGKLITLQPPSLIVQEWSAVDMPRGHISLVTFNIIPLPKNRTQLTMKHENLPSAMAAGFDRGWKDFYWKPFKTWLQSKTP